jgi:hypothetical protein
MSGFDSVGQSRMLNLYTKAHGTGVVMEVRSSLQPFAILYSIPIVCLSATVL